MNNKLNIIIGFGAALLFTVLYLFGALSGLEDRLYDFSLRFRANRQRIENVVFLDIDDNAIMTYGLYPWPRSIPAEGLLRLKEYDARAAIFDIEYIDYGPQGIDSVYLQQGLGNDFFRSFSGISNAAQEIFTAFKTGRIRPDELDRYEGYYYGLIEQERGNLYNKTQNVARDNDLYLAQAIALNKNAWTTLNLTKQLLEGEQAERRPLAEELFSYPVKAADNANPGSAVEDVLPALPRFSQVAKGAGYTNVEIDKDGIRRRVYLTQNVFDHWYLQLSFAPLIDYLGRPEILLEKNKLTIKQAQMPDGRIKDIVVPLDHKGRMMLDWPKTSYYDSYTHISFAEFAFLEQIEAETEMYCHAFMSAGINYFAQFDPSLANVSAVIGDVIDLFDAAKEYKTRAMEYDSDDDFNLFIEYRNMALSMLDEINSLNIDEKLPDLAEQTSLEFPQDAETIQEEADYISQLANAFKINVDRHNELTAKHSALFKDNFVIMGWSATGTTDIGANPFDGEYINIGTHGVVLDTILSESFIIPLPIWWSILLLLIIVPAFFILSGNLTPVVRASSGFAATLIIFAGAILLFRFTGIFWGSLGTVLAMLIAVVAREIVSYAGSEKEKKFIRTAFSTYLSGDVVKEIISDPSRLQLGGTKRNMTAIFTDVKAFSTISEKLDPEELVSLLNKYLTAMCDIILEEKGTIDKFEGDAIIAFFGAPIDLPDHALRACVSSIRIKKAEEELNKEIMAQKLAPMPLLTRVGVNTGFMVVGNMGTASKMNYTIMGDSVNLAARLEGVNKQYGTWILASEDTIKETGDKLLYRKLDRVRVVGKSEPVRLCELIDVMSDASGQDKKRVAIFHEALAHFENREWQQASEGFKEALDIKADDEPAKMYLDRCKEFISKPPKDEWDGVYNLTSK